MGVFGGLCSWCIARALAGISGVVCLEVGQSSLVVGTWLGSVQQRTRPLLDHIEAEVGDEQVAEHDLAQIDPRSAWC